MAIILLVIAVPLKNQLAHTYVSAEQIPEQTTYLSSLPVTKVSEQELLTYSGATKMHEVDVIKSIKERLNAIKKFEGKK